MRKSAEKLKLALSMLARGHARFLAGECARRLYSSERFYGLRRDLDTPFDSPDAKIPLTIRPLTADEVHRLLREDGPDGSVEDSIMRARRRLFFQQGVPTCYGAVTRDGAPAYMQWLIGPDQNGAIQSYFDGKFPTLNPDEALLEFAFSSKDFRGMRVMPHAMAEIAAKGRDLGARYVITFVDEDNVPALKGCQRAGFSPYLMREDRWRLFRSHSTFTPLPPSTPYPYETANG